MVAQAAPAAAENRHDRQLPSLALGEERVLLESPLVRSATEPVELDHHRFSPFEIDTKHPIVETAKREHRARRPEAEAFGRVEDPFRSKSGEGPRAGAHCLAVIASVRRATQHNRP